jgi:HlyD family secretion protein
MLAIAAVAPVGYGLLPKEIPVDVVEVQRMKLESWVEVDGRTRVRERYLVAAPLSANLRRIELEPGDLVPANEVLAWLDPPDPALLDARSRAEATARLHAARAHRQQADAALIRAQVQAEHTAREAERLRFLSGKGATSQASLDQADHAQRAAAADLALAELERRVTAAEVASAEAILGSVRHGGAAPIAIRAPAAGRVLRVLRESEGPVSAGTPLVEIGDASALEVVVDVLSSDAVKLAPGGRATLEQWGGDRQLTARIRKIEPAAFTQLSALGVEEQRVNVVLTIEDPPPNLGDGFRVEAKLITESQDDVLAAPTSALFRQADGWATFELREGRAALTAVEVGQRSRHHAEVRGGIEAGAKLIAYPSEQISAGVRVAPR